MTGAAEGELLGPYRLVRRLGRGGMGEVWLAEHVQIQSQVAIKLMLGDPSDDGAAARFLREAKATARIRHPGVITVSDFGERPGGGAYLVMELLDGETLSQRLERGAVPLELALDLGLQIAEALAAAHAAEVIHRDLKPANVFLVPDPAARSGLRVKLLDFGVAKATGRVTDELGLTITGALVGTPVYMAPEQCTSRRGPVDHRADLYALGVVLYEMLTGKPPFRGPTLGDLIDQHLNATPAPVRSSTPGVPPRLDALVLALLAKQREDRPVSANDVARTLAELGNVAPAVPASGSRSAGSETALDATLASGPRAAPEGLEATVDSGARVASPALAATVGSLAGAAPPSTSTVPAGTSPGRPSTPPDSVDAAPPRATRRRWLVLGGAVVLAAGAGIAARVVLRRDPPLDVSRATDAQLERACDDRDGRACFALGMRALVGPAMPDLSRVFSRMQAACDLGALDGCARAAWMLMSGTGMQASPRRAYELADRACTGDHALGCDLAGDLLAQGTRGEPDRVRALATWRRGCDLGAPGACQSAASTLRHGLGVPRDPDAAAGLLARARELAERACANKDAQGCRIHGHLYIRGTGVPQDATRGGEYLVRACELGSVEACGELGELHLLGTGVAKDPARALALLERVCARGFSHGCQTLALGHAYGLFGAVDAAKGFAIARDACERHGDPYCGTLANLYQLGLGTPVDLTRAKSYLDRACAGGDSDACANVAEIEVPGVTRSEAETEKLLVRACALGSALGCYKLGLRERKRAEYGAAVAHFETACALSDGQFGCPQLASAYFDGQGVAADPARGREILETGCANKAQIVCYALGLRLRDGKGLPASPADALAAFEQACELGWAKACLAAEAMLTSANSGLTIDAARAARFHERACTLEPVVCKAPAAP